MNDERVVDDIITKFLLNTCRLRPQRSIPVVMAIGQCAMLATRYPVDDEESDVIPLITGSVAEFYIEPMFPHVGDVDVMYYFSTELAIPRGHPPPSQLPDKFHNYVQVMEIIDSHLPGYVYLQLCYLLAQCVDEGKYNAVEYDRVMHALNCRPSDRSNMHGPAILIPTQSWSSDYVPCKRCLSWPSQPLIGQHDRETTAGQTQQLLIVLSATDVMWLVWHIVSVDNIK